MKKVLLVVVALLLFTSGIALGSSINGDYQGFPIVKVIVNGQQVQSDVPAIMLNGRTMVPLRFVSEALNKDVRWDNVSFAASVSDKVTFADANKFQLAVDGWWFQREKLMKEAQIAFKESLTPKDKLTRLKELYEKDILLLTEVLNTTASKELIENNKESYDSYERLIIILAGDIFQAAAGNYYWHAVDNGNKKGELLYSDAEMYVAQALSKFIEASFPIK